MNEMYEEILVSAKDDGKSRVLSILLFVISVIGLAGGMWIHVALLLVGIAAFVGGYIMGTRVHREFEYAYTSGQIDIDVIYNKTKRKNIAVYDSEQLLCLAPKGSAALDNYPKDITVMDYTSGKENVPYYVAIYKTEKGQVALHLELPATVVNNMRMQKPRCVFMN